MAMTRKAIEFIGWRPFEVVIIPDIEHFDMYDLYEYAKNADEELSIIMARVILENKGK